MHISGGVGAGGGAGKRGCRDNQSCSLSYKYHRHLHHMMSSRNTCCPFAVFDCDISLFVDSTICLPEGYFSGFVVFLKIGERFSFMGGAGF